MIDQVMMAWIHACSYFPTYHIAGMFGGDNVWQNQFDKVLPKKVCTIQLLYNVHVMFGWF